MTVILISFVCVTDDTLQKKVNCTACGKQVNQFQRNSVHKHPALKVLICKVGKSVILHGNSITIKFHPDLFPSLHSCIADIISSSSSHATSITQVMTSAKTLMGWMSSAGTKFYARTSKTVYYFC